MRYRRKERYHNRTTPCELIMRVRGYVKRRTIYGAGSRGRLLLPCQNRCGGGHENTARAPEALILRKHTFSRASGVLTGANCDGSAKWRRGGGYRKSYFIG